MNEQSKTKDKGAIYKCYTLVDKVVFMRIWVNNFESAIKCTPRLKNM